MSASDRELLELAAKAMQLRPEVLSHWNPLIDDSSCFRVACRLRIDLEWNEEDEYVQACHSKDLSSPLIRELYAGRVDEATRRAIVREAAEIGRAMP